MAYAKSFVQNGQDIKRYSKPLGVNNSFHLSDSRDPVVDSRDSERRLVPQGLGDQVGVGVGGLAAGGTRRLGKHM
jgi:hypothetical protein